MTIKSVLTWIDADAGDGLATRLAFALADRCGAHVTGAALEIDAYAPSYDGVLSQEFADVLRAQAKERSDAAIALFHGSATAADVPHDALCVRGLPYEAESEFAMLARRFDLTVLPQHDPDRDTRRSRMIEAVLFSSGRPLLIAPYVWKPPLRLNRMMVAWDGGVSGTRALAAATPLLKTARAVEVVAVGSAGPDNLSPAFDIALHLSRHGLPVELKTIPGSDVAAALLSHAADSGADLLVMGGYGHSRFRESLFGGATRGVLQSMTLPVFMVH